MLVRFRADTPFPPWEKRVSGVARRSRPVALKLAPPTFLYRAGHAVGGRPGLDELRRAGAFIHGCLPISRGERPNRLLRLWFVTEPPLCPAGKRGGRGASYRVVRRRVSAKNGLVFVPTGCYMTGRSHRKEHIVWVAIFARDRGPYLFCAGVSTALMHPKRRRCRWPSFGAALLFAAPQKRWTVATPGWQHSRGW